MDVILMCRKETHMLSILDFVNREKELEFVGGALDALVEPGTLLRNPIIEFYGTSGIGKTYLLQRIEQEFHARNMVIEEQCRRRGVTEEERRKRKIVCVLVDLERDRRIPEVVERVIAAVNWWNSSARLKGPSEQLEQVVNIVREGQGKWDESAQRVFIQEYMSVLLREAVPVALIFDTLEQAGEEELGWLAETIRDLVDVGKLLVILGSKNPVLFEQTREVTRKLRLKQLQAFSVEDVRAQWGDKAIDELLENVAELTAGHPLANQVIFEAIEELGIEDEDDFQDHELDLVTTLERKVVDEWMLGDVAKAERSRFKDILTVLSVPRQFNVQTMRTLIESYVPQHRLAAGLYYLDLISEIRAKTRLIDLAPRGNLYTIDPATRCILLSHWKLEKPQTYNEVHRKLIEMYNGWVADLSGFDRNRYLLELVYHMSKVPKQRRAIERIFAKHLESLHSIERVFAKHLESFEDAGDCRWLLWDLQSDDELQRALGKRMFNGLVQCLEAKLETLKTSPERQMIWEN